MRKKIRITSSTYPDMALRSIQENDLEDLRCWKNDNRKSFFYQELISPKQQEQWYAQYLDREWDYMFMIEEQGYSIGCMGFRIQDEGIADLYNIIRGRKGLGKIYMIDSMHLMLSFIADTFPKVRLQCDVLKNNPAVAWYQKCGFAILEEREYYIMEIVREKILQIQILISEDKEE